MGLDFHGTRFLLYASRLGADFTRTAMIGRQGLHLRPSDLDANMAKLGFACDAGTVARIFRDGYAEELLRFLGASLVESIDHSAYEGATRQHDLNEPIPDELRQAFSLVLDGGSLEHVFNFPAALKNCMEMVRPGGHYLAITPANNFMGHGFYQFSPELFLSVFTAAQGYELVRLIAFEDSRRAPWYLVRRPDRTTTRIMLRSRKPVYLLVLARRIADVEPLMATPQQSDYEVMWSPEAPLPARRESARGPLMGALLAATPERVKQAAKIVLGRRRRKWRFDPRSFTKLDWKAELASLPGRAAEG